MFVVVADGMGGHIGGEMCSQLTANIMKRFFNAIELKGKTTQQISFTATKAVKYLSKKLEQYSEEHPDLIDMGTTLNMNIFLDDYFLNLNVGDSRTTKFTKHKNVQISEDQNMATAAKKDPSLAK
ncbi:MAG: hypothetical protein DRP42_03975 [Tenericutes bacterium]|nr:MAG: hypothetical protein DRP42_03975 [Mycoplasmatota bacterium]